MKADMPQMKCVDPMLGELLVPYGLGTLSAEDATRFEDHVMECHFCQTELEASFNAFELLSRVRPELVEDLQKSGEGFESQLARLGQKQSDPVVRNAGGFAYQLQRFWNAFLNPWVYGPVAATVAAIIIIIQLDVRPPEIATKQPPQIARDQTTTAPPENSALAHAPVESRNMAIAPQSETMSMGITGSVAPDETADQSPISSEESRLSAQKPGSLAKTKRIDQPIESDHPVRENLPELANTSTSAPETIVLKEEVSSMLVSARNVAEPSVQEKVSEFLKDAPPYSEDGSASLMEKSLGFTAEPQRAGRSDAKLGIEKSLPMQSVAGSPEIIPVDHFKAGIDAYQKKDFAAAAKSLGTFVRQNPADSRAWFYLGASQSQTKSWKAALQSFATSDSLSGGHDAITRYYLALAAIKNGETVRGASLLNSIAIQTDSLGTRAAELKKLLDQPPPPK